MKPVIGAHAPEDRDEEASAWCARLASGALSPDEQGEFDRWTAADPGNEAAFDRALFVWRGLHDLKETPEIIAMRADALDALRRANQRRWLRRGGFGWRLPLALVASLALVVFASLALLPSRAGRYETGVGERRTILLADGSRLSLDADTRVTVDLDDDVRRLALLAGRAKFDVAKDPTRPFVVTAGPRTVVATGTAFSVELLGGEMRVIVYEGRVAVLPGPVPTPARLLRIRKHPEMEAAAISLKPGRELVADRLAPTPKTLEADVGRSLAWEGGQLDFVDEPLASAVERLNRYSAEKIAIADAAAAAIQVNGVFNAGDTPAFVEAVSATYDLRVRQDATGIVLSTGSPPRARPPGGREGGSPGLP